VSDNYRPWYDFGIWGHLALMNAIICKIQLFWGANVVRPIYFSDDINWGKRFKSSRPDKGIIKKAG